MTLEIEKLKAVALAATPGPWFASAGDVAHLGRVECVTDDLASSRARFIGGGEGDAESRANCRFVAASNPATIFALIAEVERLRAAIAGAGRLVPRADDFGQIWHVTPEQAAQIDAAIEAHTTARKDPQ